VREAEAVTEDGMLGRARIGARKSQMEVIVEMETRTEKASTHELAETSQVDEPCWSLKAEPLLTVAPWL
jgi:hypothetical protein